MDAAATLMGLGANPNAKNANGETAPDLARQQGHEEVATTIELLGTPITNAHISLPPGVIEGPALEA